MSKNNPKSEPSYHSSLDHLLFIPGVGHVAPDTYSGYGSLLDSDIDDDTEATSALYLASNTVVPDSIPVDLTISGEKLLGGDKYIDACVEEKEITPECHRSGDLSPRSVNFNRYCTNFLEKKRKKDEKRVEELYDFDADKLKSAAKSGDLSPMTKKFNAFYARQLERINKNC